MAACTDNPKTSVETNVETSLETRHTCGLTELVRGSEGKLLDEFTPVVQRETVALDLHSVERIDAAGIAALISLYRAAHESGHGFCLANVAPRVRELLRLVGLDHILVSHNAEFPCGSAPNLVQTAA